MKGEIYSLFPTAVGRYSLERNFTKKELNFINSQDLVPNTGNKTSKNRYVFKRKALSSLYEFSVECANHYLKNIFCPKHEISLRITQSWLNYTKKGEYHHQHKHPNSFLSGVFYINADRDRDKILFATPVVSGNIDIPPESHNFFNSKEWWLPVSSGDLLIFPSTLHHSVPGTETDNRISLSFNTFPVGYVGNEENLTALYLSDT